jgi:hypothetical protein
MKIFKILLFTLGLILLGISVTGLFKSLRNEDLYSEITPYKDDISIRFSEAKKQWDRLKNESDQDFALRSTMLINHAMAHYWKDEGIIKYHMQVPLWENYILSIRQWISGNKKYEFRNYKKAIERGVGICSQPCIALKYLLNDNGIKADLWDLKGHVVVETTFSNSIKYMLDPDYGQFVPYGMKDIQANPDLVRESYKNQDNVYAAHVKEHKHTDDIVNLYEKDGNHIYYMDKTFEVFSYIAIWILPLLLIIPFALTLLKKSRV